jgi:prepilin-type N-terminal cleavage/methylation domain-containing protein
MTRGARGRANERGLTLIELVATITIMGVIMVPLSTALIEALQTAPAASVRTQMATDTDHLGATLDDDVQQAGQLQLMCGVTSAGTVSNGCSGLTTAAAMMPWVPPPSWTAISVASRPFSCVTSIYNRQSSGITLNAGFFGAGGSAVLTDSNASNSDLGQFVTVVGGTGALWPSTFVTAVNLSGPAASHTITLNATPQGSGTATIQVGLATYSLFQTNSWDASKHYVWPGVGYDVGSQLWQVHLYSLVFTPAGTDSSGTAIARVEVHRSDQISDFSTGAPGSVPMTDEGVSYLTGYCRTGDVVANISTTGPDAASGSAERLHLDLTLRPTTNGAQLPPISFDNAMRARTQ